MEEREETFYSKLTSLYMAAGMPTVRDIAQRTEGQVSHTTVSTTLRGVTLPKWHTIKPIIEALGADASEVAKFKELWSQTVAQPIGNRRPRRSPTPTDYEVTISAEITIKIKATD